MSASIEWVHAASVARPQLLTAYEEAGDYNSPASDDEDDPRTIGVGLTDAGGNGTIIFGLPADVLKTLYAAAEAVHQHIVQEAAQ